MAAWIVFISSQFTNSYPKAEMMLYGRGFRGWWQRWRKGYQRQSWNDWYLFVHSIEARPERVFRFNVEALHRDTHVLQLSERSRRSWYYSYTFSESVNRYTITLADGTCWVMVKLRLDLFKWCWRGRRGGGRKETLKTKPFLLFWSSISRCRQLQASFIVLHLKRWFVAFNVCVSRNELRHPWI